APDAAHLETNDTGADDAEAFRHVGNGERSGVAEDELLVELDARQRARIGTGGHDHMLCLHHLVAHRDLVPIGSALDEAAVPEKKLDLVLAEEEGDAVV